MEAVSELRAAGQQVRGESILARSVCLMLRCSYFGNYRKVALPRVVEAAGGQPEKMATTPVKTTKTLVKPSRLTAAFRVQEDARTFLRQKAIPGSRVFGDGSYLVPVGVLQEVVAGLKGYRTALAVEAELLAAGWEEAIEEQRPLLGDLFDRSDYPPPHEVREAWGISWTFVAFGSPDKLMEVDAALAEESHAQKVEEMNRAWDEVRLVMRGSLQQLLLDLAERLKPDKNGRQKGIRPEALDDVMDFLDSFPKRDLTDDAGLRAETERIRAMLDGVDVESLRGDEQFRSSVLAATSEAAGRLAELVQEAGRGISFGGEL